MKLSVYLAEDRIQVVLGKWRRKIHIKNCEEYILPKGTLINDVVINESQFLMTLQKIREKYHVHRKHVCLMLGSNQIITKTIHAPTLPESAMTALVRSELEHLAGEQPILYDYSVIGDKLILGAGMRSDTLQKLESLFSASGMTLKSVDIAINGMIHLSQSLLILKERTYLLCLADGRNMMASIYKNGQYVYTGRNRLIAERNTEEALHEIGKYIEALIQFYDQEKHQEQVKFIYLGGFSQEEKQWLKQYIDEKLKITVDQLLYFEEFNNNINIKYSLEQYYCATGNLYGR